MKAIRTLVHIVVAILGWVLFVWLWWRALQYGPTQVHLRGTIIVGMIDLVIVLVTVLWILWNKDIYRRKGPRTTVPPVDFDYAVDALGTPVDVRVTVGDHTRSVTIEMIHEQDKPTKVFTTVPFTLAVEGEA